MNAAHVHLLVNHLPIVGATLAVPLLVLAAMMPRQRGLVVSVAVILTLAAGGATWTGASGGVIRHTEIRGGAGAAASSAPDAAVQGDADRQGRGRGHGGDHDDD